MEVGRKRKRWGKQRGRHCWKKITIEKRGDGEGLKRWSKQRGVEVEKKNVTRLGVPFRTRKKLGGKLCGKVEKEKRKSKS